MCGGLGHKILTSSSWRLSSLILREVGIDDVPNVLSACCPLLQTPHVEQVCPWEGEDSAEEVWSITLPGVERNVHLWNIRYFEHMMYAHRAHTATLAVNCSHMYARGFERFGGDGERVRWP